MSRRFRISAVVAGVVMLAGCEAAPEVVLQEEYAWAGSLVPNPPQGAAASTDSVVYAMYADIDVSGRADGVLTVMNDTTRWHFDPYLGLVAGFMMRDSVNAPVHMLAELLREHDGAACRMQGPIDSLGWWSAELTCGGEVADSVRLLPTHHGFITGRVTSHSTEGPDEGVRVSYCPFEGGKLKLSDCKAAGYTGAGGLFRLRVPPGEWFVVYSIWDPIRDQWDYCRSDYDSDSYLGRFVTVRLAQASDASRHCPVFFGG